MTISDQDVRCWASSIGSDVIDIVDKRSPKQPVRVLRAGPSDKNMDALRKLRDKLAKVDR